MRKPMQGNQIHQGRVHPVLYVALLSLLLSACSTIPSPAERTQQADALTAAAGWSQQRIPAGHFTLAAYLSPAKVQSQTLTIYIEGDGAAWLNRLTPSADPTPLHATGLELALQHRGTAVAYLARPCQFVADADRHGCGVAYWTGARFAPEVIEATGIAIDVLKNRVGATRVVLVGYSGGGAVAALVASQRSDVVRLVTVAGNLDPTVWTQMHGADPLTGSLNPADRWRQLVSIPQVHFVGAQDHVMDKQVALAFRNRFPIGHQPEVVIVQGFDHQCCWVRDWPQLQRQ